jgi:putative colanic acid biosynthesis acetyltransferase WcaF
VIQDRVQDLSRPPASFNLRKLAILMLIWSWEMVRQSIFALSPSFANPWRRLLLRIYGANIGKDVIVRASAKITYPWKLSIGDCSWIGENAKIYNLDHVYIGAHAVVSQECYLCTGSHDYCNPRFPQTTRPIKIEDEAWLATDVFVYPGVNIGKGAVVGARSIVTKDVAPYTIGVGTPLRIIGHRKQPSPRD